MDTANHFSLLEMIEHPAFCVCDGVIVRANQAAKSKLFGEGEHIMAFLPTDNAAYGAFSGGCLYLNVTSASVTCGASVTRIEDFDLFVLDTEGSKLEAYALASLQLKMPLCNIVSLLEDLIVGDKQYDAKAADLRHNVYQLSRVVNNMADASWLRLDSTAQPETTELGDLFDEIMEQMDTLVKSAGCHLEFQNLHEPVTSLADRELLFRAVSNILSNAVKFSPKGSVIRASLTKKGDFVYFTVADPGDSQQARCNVFTRYLRPAVIEDRRHGLGLGMAIIHAVAVDHGGTVLVDTPEGGGTRVTMSLAVRQSSELILRTPTKLPGRDYTAGLDAGLVEFSEVLPAKHYKDIKK